MNKKPRRKFSSEFKARVALEALRERESIETLCKKFDLHPNQIFQWKKTLKEGSNCFCLVFWSIQNDYVD
jgi:transposase-like protein